MRVNLKKANDYAESAKTAAAAIKISPKVILSIYSTDDVAAKVGKHVETVRKQVDDVTALLDAQFTIRHQIGRQNAEHGVNNLLTERKRIEAVESRLSNVLALVNADADEGSESEALDSVRGRMDAMKARIAANGYAEEKIVIDANDPAMIAGLKADLLRLRREKEANKDAVTAINMTHEVVLSDAVLATLRKHEIIA